MCVYAWQLVTQVHDSVSLNEVDCMRNKKKQVLILTSTFPRWEGDTDPPFVFDLCKRIKNRYSIHLLTPQSQGTEARQIFHGIDVKRFRYFFKKWQTLAYEGGILNRLKQNPFRYLLVPFFFLGELIATMRLLSSNRFSLINAHWLIPQGLVAVIAKSLLKSTVPVVCTVHGSDIFALKGFFLTAIKRFILLRSSEIIVVSRAMEEKVLSFGIRASRVHVISMGVDLKTEFKPPEGPRRKRSLLFVGKLDENKGLLYLIKAFAIVLRKYPDSTLTVVGHGPQKNYYQELVSTMNLNGKVEFSGAVQNRKLPEIYRSSEVVVFPSVAMEGFGLVMVEALGCECAVIASDLPATHEIIIEGKTGLIVEQKNVEQIAQKILFLFDNPDIQRSLGKSGRRYVLERYDWSVTEKKYCDLFDGLTCS